MRGGAKKGWRWRVADSDANRNLNLLYEPGNWGDILKGAWAVRIVQALARARRAGSHTPAPIRYLDPFAGAPAYPLVAASADKLQRVPLEGLRRLLEPHARRGLMASTGILVRDAAREAEAEVRLLVFDSDPARAEAWRGTECTTLLEAASGEAALEAAFPPRRARGGLEPGRDGDAVDFVLVDPYDFFVRWTLFLPAILRASESAAVLSYLYNRSPRGPGQQRMYKEFREGLRSGLRGRGRAFIGRIPADPGLARAHHEVILLGPEEVVAELEAGLAADSRALARAMADLGAFETVGA